MNTELFISLGRNARVVYNNFWFKAQQRNGIGRWIDVGSSRKFNGALAMALFRV